VKIDDEEIDVYTEDAEVDGEPVVGATATITGHKDDDGDIIASEVTIKVADKKKKKAKK
jgi:hypothetical protein